MQTEQCNHIQSLEGDSYGSSDASSPFAVGLWVLKNFLIIPLSLNYNYIFVNNTLLRWCHFMVHCSIGYTVASSACYFTFKLHQTLQINFYKLGQTVSLHLSMFVHYSSVNCWKWYTAYGLKPTSAAQICHFVCFLFY